MKKKCCACIRERRCYFIPGHLCGYRYHGLRNFFFERTGFGSYVYDNGDLYRGEWLYGKRHGKGTLRYAHGDVYRGEWKYDEECGMGRMVFASKDHYQGEFRKGLMQGQGEFTYKADGAKYRGEFHEGEFR